MTHAACRRTRAIITAPTAPGKARGRQAVYSGDVNRPLGRYELLRPIARGGMAEVFLARRRGAAGVQKRLVIKRIRPERAGDPRLLGLFVKEARLSMDLVHANIVPVFDFGRVGDALFLAMEFVDGRDLGAALLRSRERGAALDPLLVAHIGGEACQALHYAHGKKDGAGNSPRQR